MSTMHAAVRRALADRLPAVERDLRETTRRLAEVRDEMTGLVGRRDRLEDEKRALQTALRDDGVTWHGADTAEKDPGSAAEDAAGTVKGTTALP